MFVAREKIHEQEKYGPCEKLEATWETCGSGWFLCWISFCFFVGDDGDDRHVVVVVVVVVVGVVFAEQSKHLGREVIFVEFVALHETQSVEQ